MQTASRLFLLLIMLCLPVMVQGERMERHGDYDIHFNAMPTTRLSPGMADAHGIPRSRTLGMVLVIVLRDGEPVDANVRGRAYSENDRPRDIQFRRIRDATSLSTVGVFRISDLERLRFEIDVRPEAGNEVYPLRFRQRFFVD